MLFIRRGVENENDLAMISATLCCTIQLQMVSHYVALFSYKWCRIMLHYLAMVCSYFLRGVENVNDLAMVCSALCGIFSFDLFSFWIYIQNVNDLAMVCSALCVKISFDLFCIMRNFQLRFVLILDIYPKCERFSYGLFCIMRNFQLRFVLIFYGRLFLYSFCIFGYEND